MRPVRLYLIRHGEAAARWTEENDPGLSGRGVAQAHEAAETLAALSAMPIKSSPLRRAQETAAPLAARWAAPVEIIKGVAEIPSPEGVALSARHQWLFGVMAGGWAGADEALHSWRRGVIDALLAQREDCAIFSHFVAINTAVGAATGVDAIISFKPDNGSITIFETDGTSLRLVELGRELDTVVG